MVLIFFLGNRCSYLYFHSPVTKERGQKLRVRGKQGESRIKFITGLFIFKVQSKPSFFDVASWLKSVWGTFSTIICLQWRYLNFHITDIRALMIMSALEDSIPIVELKGKIKENTSNSWTPTATLYNTPPFSERIPLNSHQMPVFLILLTLV